ncbi:hypothetical protein M9Y10_045019 [Tritrichomonas musculus]|uniref:Uncharacterized protein n=1 Tax=Tritrichomonas musculus TaxID=1915356 RepID=A0ABR2JVZ0_9EUKA
MSHKVTSDPKGMSYKVTSSVQVMSHKQHITKNPPITQPKYTHPPTHIKENLSSTDGSSKRVNAKELILYKDDINTYTDLH